MDASAPPIAREGWPIIATFALVTVGAWVGLGLVAAGAGAAAGLLGLLATGWCVWFFRDPPRHPPADPGVLLAPADGVVCAVERAAPPPELGLPDTSCLRVSIFMNVFDVHVNRSPADATVIRVVHRPGRFFNASRDKASEHNERCAMRLRLEDGSDVACVQIAGLIARRIVCRVAAGDTLRAGERFGMIRFGSRVDVYLPSVYAASVSRGMRTRAGETIIARRADGRACREPSGACRAGATMPFPDTPQSGECG